MRAYGAAMGSVCTCSRCKEWDLQQDPVRAVHNFYSDTNPGVSEACDTNKTTPSCVCQPGSKVYYRACVCVSQLSSCVPLSSHASLLKNIDYGACASVSWPCMCVSARFEGLVQSVSVSQQSSCSSSHAAAHAPPSSPPASPPTYRAFAKILAKYSARVARQNTRLGWL